MKFYISIIIILLSVFSCKSLNNKKESLLGSYKYESPVMNGILNLRNNGEFFYNFHGDLSYSSKGQWFIYNNMLVLKSDISFKTNCFYVNESSTNESKIYIHDNEGQTDDVGVQVNGVFYETTNGVLYLKDKDIGSVQRIQIYDLGSSEEYYVKDKQSNTFDITVVPFDVTKRYFNDTLKIGKGYLKFMGLKYQKVK